MDVGANTGLWTHDTMAQLQRASSSVSHTRFELVIVEPQPKFEATLTKLASRWGGRLLRAAAWKSALSNVTFWVAGVSESASLNRNNAWGVQRLTLAHTLTSSPPASTRPD